MRRILSVIFQQVKMLHFLFFRKFNPHISSTYRHDKEWFYINTKTRQCERLLPNLVIIGAQRSGTTSLHEYLKSHKEIFMSHPVKEPNFYTSQINFSKQKLKKAYGAIYHDHYELLKNCILQGYKGEQYIGEATTYYTMADLAKFFNVPQNMHKVMPEMRLIYQLRNPFDRIISSYRLVVALGREHRDYNTYVAEDNYAVSNSMYFDQIQAYLEFFPASQIKITCFEHFKKNPQKVLSQIYTFLNIPDQRQANRFKTLNAIKKPVNFLPKDFLLKPSLYNELAKKFTTQTTQINQTFGTNIQWDFSPDKWCKKQ